MGEAKRLVYATRSRTIELTRGQPLPVNPAA